MAAVLDQRLVLVERAVDRQRPAFAHQPHVGQRLLHAETAGGAAHDEDEVEVAVAHLVHLPVRRLATEALTQRRLLREILGEGVHVERAVTLGHRYGSLV